MDFAYFRLRNFKNSACMKCNIKLQSTCLPKGIASLGFFFLILVIGLIWLRNEKTLPVVQAL